MKNLIHDRQLINNELTKSNYKEFLYIFDTNTLLNLYRYSYETSANFLKILSDLRDYIWIPFHTALEFNNNRRKVINTQIKAFEEAKNALNGNYSDLKSKLKKLSIENRHPAINVEKLSKQYKELLLDSTEMLDELEVKYKLFLKDDPILTNIVDLLDEKVGAEPKKEEVSEWVTQASERLKKEIPPGYRDANKKGYFSHNEVIYEKRYSDYILWFQILKKLEQDKIKNAVFITDDKKDDWFEVSLLNDKPELRLELQNDIKYNSTGTEKFIAMNSIDLIRFISENKLVNVSDDSIEEMIEDSNYKFLLEDSGRIPYVLVIYPDENRCAVYSRAYELIREQASPSLINFAIENHTNKVPVFQFTHSWQQPTWMYEEIKNKCITYWLWKFKPNENMPKR